MKELVLTVAARRGARAEQVARGEAIEVEELRIDSGVVQAFIDGESAELTPTEFRLLSTLARDRGRVGTWSRALRAALGARSCPGGARETRGLTQPPRAPRAPA